MAPTEMASAEARTTRGENDAEATEEIDDAKDRRTLEARPRQTRLKAIAVRRAV